MTSPKSSFTILKLKIKIIKINEIRKPEGEKRVEEQQGMAQPSMHTMVSPEERDAISARQFQQEELQA